ncbi:MAG: zf-TFIIB domain-containing protein [Candidatus Eremiobacteraeota bacterium]|nr:zf-TFIIB domain-containing protein [Candidatus Eremiobacteraeota bacterium]
MAIPCPVCQKTMHIIYAYEIELDHCRWCGGLWFDADEMEKLTTFKKAPKLVTHPMAYDPTQARVEEGKRTCPRCGRGLQVIDYKGVNIDACMGCRGIWFDRFEVAKVMGITEGLPRTGVNYHETRVERREPLVRDERQGPLMNYDSSGDIASPPSEPSPPVSRGASSGTFSDSSYVAQEVIHTVCDIALDFFFHHHHHHDW